MAVTGDDRRRLEEALVRKLPDLLTEVSDRLRELSSDYADFLDADRAGLAEAARLVVPRLLEMPRDGGVMDQPGDMTTQLLFEQIGRNEMQAGHDLTRLITAFQLGARVAWQHLSTSALEIGVSPDTLASLADAVFGFVTQLSYAATRGFMQAQLEDARARERQREELVELLITGRGTTEALRITARRTDWRVPDRATVVLVDPDDVGAQRIVERLGPSALTMRRPPLVGAIIPDPGTDVGRADLARQLRGANAVVGYPVPLEVLPRAAEVAHIVARLRREGLLTGDPVFAEEHLDTVIVCRDQSLLTALRRQVLAPLAELPAHTRERLTETLAAWLRLQGDRRAMADELSIHPQTVRYRMAQLQEAFGDALDDPRQRARLFLALTWPVSPGD